MCSSSWEVSICKTFIDQKPLPVIPAGCVLLTVLHTCLLEWCSVGEGTFQAAGDFVIAVNCPLGQIVSMAEW